jgi:hypothetical protein
MSLLDYAPRDDARIEAPEDLVLHMRFSDRRAFYYALAAICFVGALVLASLVLSDPNFI